MDYAARLRFPAALGVLAPCLFGGLCWGQPTAPPVMSSPAGPSRPLGALPATALSGVGLDLAARKGWKVIYFWSVDCPCVRDCEQLSLIPLARRYAGRVAFYAVAANRPDLAEAKAHLPAFAGNVGTHGLPYAVVLDPRGTIADALGATVTPQTFLIDPKGRILFNGSPDDSWTVKNRTGRPGVTQTYLADALDEALSGRAVSRPHVKSLGCGISADAARPGPPPQSGFGVGYGRVPETTSWPKQPTQTTDTGSTSSTTSLTDRRRMPRSGVSSSPGRHAPDHGARGARVSRAA